MNTQEEQDRQFQIECLTNELVTMLMEENGMTMEQALDTVYRSHTYEKVERASTGLFYQGAVYVMDMLREELSVYSHDTTNFQTDTHKAQGLCECLFMSPTYFQGRSVRRLFCRYFLRGCLNVTSPKINDT